ncbi:MAG: hypothetical protein V4808_14370 [Pseudomonadota bacterium]
MSTAIVVPQDACPSISVSSSSSTRGEATYTANVYGGDGSASPTFNWSISAGGITQGQGTSLILVEAKPGEYVTATIEVGGYAATCSSIASDTLEISNAGPAPVVKRAPVKAKPKAKPKPKKRS